jgi:hypothetical protein
LAPRGDRIGIPSTHLGRFRNPDLGPIPYFQTVSEKLFGKAVG